MINYFYENQSVPDVSTICRQLYKLKKHIIAGDYVDPKKEFNECKDLFETIKEYAIKVGDERLAKPYTNLVSLLEEQIPERIERFYELCDNNKYVISSSLDIKEHQGILTNEEITLCNEIDSEQEIYDMSRLMKRFQTVHDVNLICIWSDKLLNKSNNIIEPH